MRESASTTASKKRKADAIEPDIATLRKEIKEWQKDFKVKHGRVPTRDDIKHEPGIWAKHQTYANLKSKTAKQSQTQSSQPSNLNSAQIIVTPSKRRRIESRMSPKEYMSPHRLKQALARISNSPASQNTPFARDLHLLRQSPSKLAPDPFEDDVEIEPTPWKRHVKKLFSPNKPEIKGELLWKIGVSSRVDSMDWKRKLLAAPLPSPKRLSAEKISRQRKLFERGASIGFGNSSRHAMESLQVIDENSPSKQVSKGATIGLSPSKNPFVVPMSKMLPLQSPSHVPSPLRPTSHPNIQQSPTAHRSSHPSKLLAIPASPLRSLRTPTKSSPRIQNVLVFPSPLAPSPKPFAIPKRRLSAMTQALELRKIREATQAELNVEELDVSKQPDDLTPFLKEIEAMVEATNEATMWNTELAQSTDLRSQSHSQSQPGQIIETAIATATDPARPVKKGLKRQHRRVHMKPVPTKTPLNADGEPDQSQVATTARPKKSKPGLPGGVSENFVSLSYKRQEKRSAGGSRFGGRFGKRK